MKARPMKVIISEMSETQLNKFSQIVNDEGRDKIQIKAFQKLIKKEKNKKEKQKKKIKKGIILIKRN